LYDRSLAEARRILETHEPTPLPEAVAAELRSIIEGAERELGVK
jgi:trimethylamine:corrinoid methyltransferase-like protein